MVMSNDSTFLVDQQKKQVLMVGRDWCNCYQRLTTMSS